LIEIYYYIFLRNTTFKKTMHAYFCILCFYLFKNIKKYYLIQTCFKNDLSLSKYVKIKYFTKFCIILLTLSKILKKYKKLNNILWIRKYI
jgi:hypothetical protein